MSKREETPDKTWQKTSFANLVRYIPSGTYFARVPVRGKLIRKSLKTDKISVAQLRMTDVRLGNSNLAMSTNLSGKTFVKLVFARLADAQENQITIVPS
ncbi:MAG: hypothetical protein FJ403_21685 [Verrucomicrobia bacterium]|nr:hypothetical protein [Verrucomicrobiota bacterium]